MGGLQKNWLFLWYFILLIEFLNVFNFNVVRPSDDEDSSDSENGLSVEAHLVNKITSEGGIRAVPSKEDLIQFTRR